MKSEALIFLALAAALTFHHRPHGSSNCSSGGCLLLPPDFQKCVEAARAKAVPAAGEKGVADSGALR